MAEQVVTLRINADGTVAVSAIDKVSAATKQMGGTAQQGGKQAADGMDKAGKSARGLADETTRARAAVGMLVAGLGALVTVQTARAVVSLADAWSDLTSQVRVNIGETEDAGAVMDRLAGIARTTYSSISATTEGFARNAQTLRALGKSTLEQLNYTAALNNALVVSGAKGEQFTQVQDALSKAMAVGNLSGIELNTVLTRGGAVAKALADELGVSTLQLRELGAAGKITGDVVFNALTKRMDEFQERAESMPATVGDAFTLVQNAVMQAVGAFDQASGSSETLANWIIKIADAIEIAVRNIDILFESYGDLDTAQEDVSASAEDVARSMQTVVTGIVIAKNVIDVLVDGFILAGEMAGTLAAAVVDSFTTAGTAMQRLVKGMTPGSGYSLAEAMAENARDMDGIIERTMEGLTKSTDSFWSTFSKNQEDVSRAFEFLNAPADAAAKAIDGTAAAAGRFAGAIGGSAKEAKAAVAAIKELADSYAVLEKMTRDLEAAGDPMAEESNRYADALQRAAEAGERAAKAGNDAAAVQEFVARATAAATAAHERNTAEIAASLDVTGQFMTSLKEEARLLGMSSNAARAESVVLRALAQAKAINAKAGRELVTVDEERIRAQALMNIAMDEAAGHVESILSDLGALSPFEQMTDDVKTLKDELEKLIDPLGNVTDQKRFDQLTAAIGRGNDRLEDRNMMLVQEGVSSLQKYAKEGTAAYTALGIAQDILAYKAAISAIANQGSGDPYSAFARIAAMIALMASIGIRVGGGGGGGGPSANSAEARQAAQGTGSVLGDSSAKSESILKATEITANATEQLVGINRGMLTALQSLQQALGAAGGMLARGAGGVDFPKQGGGGLFLGLWGDSRKIIDQGIVIAGGELQGMIDNIAIGAYQTIHKNGGFFGSSKDYDITQGVSESFGRQFQLVIGSVIDTVREGALAIGMLPAEVEAALATYRVAEIRISLKDLSAEEQQAELQAVLSGIFDGLAGHVVPFIEQFQQVGEGLGETLVRVATGVQVTQEAVKQLGFALDESDPERFAQISEELMKLTGGIDGFIEGMGAFVGAFADDGQKLRIATEAINSAFSQAGIEVPMTKDAMWDLMQSLDATTESGREQIATLLRLANVSAEYYGLLEKKAKAQLDYIAQVSALETELGMGGGFAASRVEIEQWASGAADSLNSLARTAGRAGASERDLSLVRDVAAKRMQQLIAALKAEAQDLAVLLGYMDAPDTLASLDAAIAALGDTATDVGSAMGDAVDTMRNQIALLLGDLSPLNDMEKLDVARSGLMAGTVSQEDFLQIARRLFASSSQYDREFAFAQQYPGAGAADDAQVVRIDAGDGRSLAELLTARDALLDAQRGEMAHSLASRIAELSYAGAGSFEDVATQLGFDLSALGADLGLDNDALNAYLQTLSDTFAGADFGVMGDQITGAVSAGARAIVEAIEAATMWGDPDAAPGYGSPHTPEYAQITIPENRATSGGNDSAGIESLRSELVAARELLERIVETTSDTASNTQTTAEATVEGNEIIRNTGREAMAGHPRNMRIPVQ